MSKSPERKGEKFVRIPAAVTKAPDFKSVPSSFQEIIIRSLSLNDVERFTKPVSESKEAFVSGTPLIVTFTLPFDAV